jgi:hypothetical protein
MNIITYRILAASTPPGAGYNSSKETDNIFMLTEKLLRILYKNIEDGNQTQADHQLKLIQEKQKELGKLGIWGKDKNRLDVIGIRLKKLIDQYYKRFVTGGYTPDPDFDPKPGTKPQGLKFTDKIKNYWRYMDPSVRAFIASIVSMIGGYAGMVELMKLMVRSGVIKGINANLLKTLYNKYGNKPFSTNAALAIMNKMIGHKDQILVSEIKLIQILDKMVKQGLLANEGRKYRCLSLDEVVISITGLLYKKFGRNLIKKQDLIKYVVKVTKFPVKMALSVIDLLVKKGIIIEKGANTFMMKQG